jgi:rod shape-determining protein MreD
MAAILIANLSLQSTLFPYIEILGVKPNTALIIIVSYSILRGDVEGAILGFFAGLLTDIYFNSYIGMYALMYMLAGYLCGKPFRHFFRENFFLPLSLVAVGSLLYQFIIYVVDFLLRGALDLPFYFRTIILPGAVYTLLLTVPLYSAMYGVNNKLED